MFAFINVQRAQRFWTDAGYPYLTRIMEGLLVLRSQRVFEQPAAVGESRPAPNVQSPSIDATEANRGDGNDRGSKQPQPPLARLLLQASSY